MKSSALKNRMKIPVIAAPMFLVSTPQLATQCCKNGIIGSFPLANARPISMVEEWFEFMDQNVSKSGAPYAVNMIVHRTYTRFDEELALVEKYQPEIVITSLGDPGRVVDAVHAYGGRVWSDVNDIEFAKKAAQKNVDGLILVSAGAGGHTGVLQAANFIYEVKKFFSGEIILAGGIMNGTQISTSLELGADYVYMGTRFIAAKESMASTEYKNMVVDSTLQDLILTDQVSGIPAYFIKASLINAGVDHNLLKAKNFNTPFATDNIDSDKKAWKDIWSAGQGIGQVTAIESAEKIIARLKKEFVSAQN